MSIYKKAATKRKNVRYTPSLVAYLDILGFGDLVGKTSPNRISRIIRMVKEEIIPTDSFAQAAKVQHRHFSDLTVITLPNHKLQTDPYVGPPLAYIVQHLGVAQARLIDEQIVVRGSITVGEITKSWGEFFGPALIQAYNLEHKIAVYPRIIIDQTVFEYPTTKRQLDSDIAASAMLKKYLRDDGDGLKYVDYLRIYVDELEETEWWLNFLKRHKNLIVQRLKQFNSDIHIRKKYVWLRSYHNKTIEKISEEEEDEELRLYLREKFLIP